MAEQQRDRWDATTLGREDDAFAPSGAPTAGSGVVRALSLDPDRYAISEVLGEGGMGEVRRCRDRSAARDVALKVVRPGADIHDVEGRFLREATVQARLAHPAVVPVYDVGHDANGRAYFTMKRVEGVTLDEVIQRLRAKDASALQEYGRHRLIEAFVRVCQAVDYAHARGVLHRDLKPANVMLGAFGEVYVLDWGLAKICKPAEDEREAAIDGDTTTDPPSEAGATGRGIAMGTPAYMAPEQAAARLLDARADVFSLGAILFELVAFEPLLGDPEIVAARARLPFTFDPRPSVRAPQHDIPSELDAICARATALDPADRYPSARALHEAVEAFLAVDEEQGRRQRLAAAHVARARLLSGPEAGDPARPEALGELGSALALAPEDVDARAHLVHLLRHPPKTTPPEVTQRSIQQDVARLRRMQRVVTAIYVIGWLIGYPVIVFAGGVRSVAGAILVPTAWLGAAVVILALYWRRQYHTRVAWSALGASVAIAVTSVIWGPIFIVPALTVAVIFGQILVATKAQRTHIVVLKSLALAIPAYLAHRGILDVYTRTGVAGFAVHGAIGSSRNVLYGGLAASHLATMIFGALFAGRYRDILDARVMENALFSWQLANLVPRADAVARPRPSVAAFGDDVLALLEPARITSTVGDDDEDGPRYTRIERIATTRTVEVWRCRDRILDREVEMIEARSAADDEVVRLRAQQRGQLEHPAVAPLYDVATNRSGRVYFTAKYVQGVTLERALAAVACALPSARERSRRRLLAALGQVCLAVAYAHERRVFHGALSTECIVLGGFGEVYVQGWNREGSSLRPQARQEAELDVWRLGEILRAMLDVYGTATPELDAVCSRATALGGPSPGARSLHDAIELFLSGDRDAEVRRELARTHLARAESATQRAFGGGDDFDVQARARVEALSEIGRAVRLEPESPSAIRLLFRLLTEPPPQPPPVVLDEVERLRQERARGPVLTTLLFGGLWLALYPIVAYLLGVKDWIPVLIVWSSWVCVEIAIARSLAQRKSLAVPWPMLAAMLAAMTTATLAGPFVVTPVIATVTTMSFVLVVRREWRLPTIALGALVILLPTVLGWTHILAAVDVVDDVIVTGGPLQVPSQTGVILVLTIGHLLAVLFAAEYAARFRDRLDAVEKAYLLRTWQLTKLLPQNDIEPAVSSRRRASDRIY